jgi:hypothetical protein
MNYNANRRNGSADASTGAGDTAVGPCYSRGSIKLEWR